MSEKEIDTEKLFNDIAQQQEKIKTLTQQKHSLEQTNIGLERDNKRRLEEVKSQTQTIKQMHDEISSANIKRTIAQEELKAMMDRLHKFMDKYI